MNLFTKISLLLAPYAFLFYVAFIMLNEHKFSFIAYVIFIAVVFIPNIIYAITLLKRNANATQILKWNMVFKISNIMYYVVMFIFGIICAPTIPGMVIVPLIVIMNYFLLLATSCYGAVGLILVRQQKILNDKFILINGVMHFVFCLDVLSSVIVYNKIKNVTVR